MSPVAIEASHLTKRYGSRVAVDDLSFRVDAGEVVGLLGANGAGKTTTIRLLTTVVRPTSGEIVVAGHRSSDPVSIRRHIGVLPESTGYPDQETAVDHLRYQGRLFGLSRRQAAAVAHDLLVDVGLADRAGSRIATYSRGMRQRLGLARALVNDPAVVFLDEPTLGLDPSGQQQVLDLIADLARRRRTTVVLSTHLLADVEAVCGRVLILNGGRLVANGSVGDVLSSAATTQSGRLRIPVELTESAVAALDRVRDLVVTSVDAAVGAVSVTAARPIGAGRHPRDAGTNAALVALARAEIPVLSFQLDGARLSDVFRHLTEDAAS